MMLKPRTYIVERHRSGFCTVQILEGHLLRDIEKAIDLEESFLNERSSETPDQVAALLKEDGV